VALGVGRHVLQPSEQATRKADDPVWDRCTPVEVINPMLLVVLQELLQLSQLLAR
jgi:hypothetical protein